MPFYHGTYRENLPSIARLGLRPGVVKAFPGTADGVYLSESATLCVYFLLEHYAEFGDPDSKPGERLNDFCVIVIDDARVDRSRLHPDPNVPESVKGVWLYSGVIDIAAMPVLTIEQAFAEQAQGT